VLTAPPLPQIPPGRADEFVTLQVEERPEMSDPRTQNVLHFGEHFRLSLGQTKNTKWKGRQSVPLPRGGPLETVRAVVSCLLSLPR
jgi:hypothetical protein